MNETMLVLLKIWHIIMWISCGFFFAAGIIIIFGHWIKTKSIRDYKAKYDFISGNEIKRLTMGIGAIAIAISSFINTVYPKIVATDISWIFIRLFISICFGALFYYIITLIIKYSYPTTLNKRLKKLRYAPRTSPEGNKMKLLTEEEEDVHLEEGMKVEEDIFSVDYDVWVDPKSGYVKIEKYPGYLSQTLKCNNCGFQTMNLLKEEVLTHPTKDTKGQLLKHYQCAFCKTKRKKLHKIAKIKSSDEPFELPTELHFHEERSIQVKISIKTNDGFDQEYDFNNLHDARKFMEKMEHEQIPELD